MGERLDWLGLKHICKQNSHQKTLLIQLHKIQLELEWLRQIEEQNIGLVIQFGCKMGNHLDSKMRCSLWSNHQEDNCKCGSHQHLSSWNVERMKLLQKRIGFRMEAEWWLSRELMLAVGSDNLSWQMN
jgi:hypothetical protein